MEEPGIAGRIVDGVDPKEHSARVRAGVSATMWQEQWQPGSACCWNPVPHASSDSWHTPGIAPQTIPTTAARRTRSVVHRRVRIDPTDPSSTSTDAGV